MTTIPTPPAAERRPQPYTAHGVTVQDDYAWLKDANWQEVLRDPSLLKPDIRAHLDAENAYADAMLGDTDALQARLVAEMRGRIKEDDSSVPANDGPYAYLRKFREGGQHELFGRMPRDGGDARIVLDGDALANGEDLFQIRRRAPFARPRAAGVERRPQRIGIFHAAGARLGQRRGSAGQSSSDRRRRGVGAGSAQLLLRQTRRQSSPDAGVAAHARHRAKPRYADL